MIDILKNLLVIFFIVFFVINVGGYNNDSIPTHNEVGAMIKGSIGGIFPADQ
tara:strand:+ start:670 stop:825 length:156 start_codon:yes stop_codon:yes gene_type:complete